MFSCVHLLADSVCRRPTQPANSKHAPHGFSWISVLGAVGKVHTISQRQDGDHRPRGQDVTAGNLRSLPHSTANSISAKFGLINARSVQNKSTALSEYMPDKCVDLLVVTETWLSVSSQSSVINSLCPEGFAFPSKP